MNHTAHNKLVSFIWSIADDCLRDVYVRGKYRDVILPMVVLRRLDTLTLMRLCVIVAWNGLVKFLSIGRLREQNIYL